MLTGARAVVAGQVSGAVCRRIWWWLPAHRLCFIAALVLSLGHGSPSAMAEELQALTQGAFLLNFDDAQRRYERVGYLPVGTIVRLQGEQRRIRSRDSTGRRRDDLYFEVVSQSGAEGLLREDLFVPIGAARLAVPVAPYKLRLYKGNDPEAEWSSIDDCDSDVRCLYYARSNGVYLTIEDDSDDLYYHVTLHRTIPQECLDDPAPTRCLPESEPGWIEKNDVEANDVMILDAAAADASMARWLREGKDDEAWESEIQNIKDEYGGDLRRQFGSIDTQKILCNLAFNAEVSAGWNFMIIQTNATVSLDVKDAGQYTLPEDYALERPNKDDLEEYHLYREITCDQSEPARMRKLTLESDNDKTYEIRLNRLTKRSCETSPEKGCIDWIRFLDDGEDVDKMVIVDGWDSYNAIFEQIEDTLGPVTPEYIGPDMDVRKDVADRRNLYDFIVRQIAVFKRAEDLG